MPAYRAFLGFGLSALATVVACRPLEENTIRGDSVVVDRIEVVSGWYRSPVARIYLRPGMSYANEIDVGVFGGFRPGEEPPSAPRYEERDGVLGKAIRECAHPGSGPPGVGVWFYFALPADRSPQQWLPEAVWSFASDNPSATITWMNSDGTPGVEVALREGLVKRLQWVNSEMGFEEASGLRGCDL